MTQQDNPMAEYEPREEDYIALQRDRQRLHDLEAALNAHLGGGVEVRADGSIAIASHLIVVATDDLVDAGNVVIRARSDVIRERAERWQALGAARRILMGGDEPTEAGGWSDG